VTLKDLAIMSRQMATMIGSVFFAAAHPHHSRRADRGKPLAKILEVR
jgi:hypothetical protein